MDFAGPLLEGGLDPVVGLDPDLNLILK